jgi:hypothetical protein
MPSFRLTEFSPLLRNSLRGFASGRLDCGDGVVLDLAELALHQRDGRTWVGWPAKPLVDRDGIAVRDAATGKVKYGPPLVRPADRAVAQRLEGAILAAVRRAHPDALADGGATDG